MRSLLEWSGGMILLTIIVLGLAQWSLAEDIHFEATPLSLAVGVLFVSSLSWILSRPRSRNRWD